ncbi:hypothetical protein ACVNSY_13165 [Bacillus sp. OHL2]
MGGKRQAEQETAASEEEPAKPKEEDFQWDDAADHIYHSDPKVVTPYQKKKVPLTRSSVKTAARLRE